MIKKNIYAAFLALGLLGVSCSSDDAAPVPVADLTMEILGLEVLTNGATYEGWIIIDGSPVSTGKFNSTEKQTFIVNAEQLDSATEFVLSIEPANDTDPKPSDTKLMSGTFGGNRATLSTNNIFQGFSTTTVSGTYILATPTDDPGTPNNDEFGILFKNGANAGLQLPVLPAGWKYEGWVLLTDAEVAVTTGKFTDVNDRDESSPYSRNGDAPNFPGEDFLNNAPQGLTFPADGNVTGRNVFISIEPSEDFDQATPFFLTALTSSATAMNTLVYNNFDLTGNVTR